jgi:hypothetical protein
MKEVSYTALRRVSACCSGAIASRRLRDGGQRRDYHLSYFHFILCSRCMHHVDVEIFFTFVLSYYNHHYPIFNRETCCDHAHPTQKIKTQCFPLVEEARRMRYR